MGCVIKKKRGRKSEVLRRNFSSLMEAILSSELEAEEKVQIHYEYSQTVKYLNRNIKGNVKYACIIFLVIH